MDPTVIGSNGWWIKRLVDLTVGGITRCHHVVGGKRDEGIYRSAKMKQKHFHHFNTSTTRHHKPTPGETSERREEQKKTGCRPVSGGRDANAFLIVDGLVLALSRPVSTSNNSFRLGDFLDGCP